MDTLAIAPSPSEPSETARLRAYLQCLKNVRQEVFAFYSAFPEEPLTAGEQNSLSPQLFPGAREFVSGMAGVLARKAALFKHIPVDPEKLCLRQQIANVLRHLRVHFDVLGRLSADHFLMFQSPAIVEARGVIDRVQKEGELFCDKSPEQQRRRLFLRYPASFLPQRGRPQKKPGGARSKKRSRLSLLLQGPGPTRR